MILIPLILLLPLLPELIPLVIAFVPVLLVGTIAFIIRLIFQILLG